MPKIIDHEQRRREIVDVAKRIILKGGFEAATMRSIAAEAGFANGALKHYFAGKDSIVGAMFEDVLAQLGAIVAPVDGEDARAQLIAFLWAPIPRTPEQIADARVLLALWEYAMTNDDLAELYRQHLRTWREALLRHLTAAHEAGQISYAGPYEVIAREYIAVTIGASVVNLMYPAGERIPDYEAYIDSFIARLG